VTSATSRRAVIVGAYESPRRKARGVHPYAIHAEVVRGALSDAGLQLSDVDGFCTATTMKPEGALELGLIEIAEYLGIRPRWFDGTDTGGAAFVTHAAHAARAIEAGLCDVVVVTYAAVGRTWPFPYEDTVTNPYGPGAFELPYGPSTIANYALAATRHAHEHRSTPEQLATIAVQARSNATLNEHAMYRDPITVADVIASRPMSSPLRQLDCCVVSDSGGAFVLTTSERARNLRGTPVEILGAGEAFTHVHMSQMPNVDESAAVHSGAAAFSEAGMTPRDVDCVQLYDSFTITVLLSLEALGFCAIGSGGEFVESGALAPTGELPFNTDGGGLSSNHPGRRGALAVIEGVRQLRGESPGANVAGVSTCLVHATGGFLSSAATLLLGLER
jgi:acetyl-CoA C-acetyltransferase